MKRLPARIAVLGLLAAVAVSCGSDDPSSSDGLTEVFKDVVIRVGHTADNAMVLLRDATSAFEGSPYEIEWVKFDSSTAVLEGVSSGSVDFAGVLQSPSVLIPQGNAEPAWTESTVPFKIVAGWEGRDDPGMSLIVRDPLVTEVAQLSGKKLAVSRGTIGHYFWMSIEQSEAIENVELVLLPASEGRAALQSGAVDALITSHRAAYSMEEKGDGTIIDSSARIAPTSYVSVMSASAAESEKKVLAVEDLLDRMKTAVEMASTDPQPVIEFLQKTFELDEEAARTFAAYDVLLRIDLEEELLDLLTDISRVFFENGIVATLADPALLLDQRFA